MLSIAQICDQYAYLYLDPPGQGDFDHIIDVDGAYTAVKHVDGVSYVYFRGSTTFLDWIEDFDDAALPYDDHILGPVHPGARQGILSIKDRLDDLLGEKVVLIGHSLGAMHAVLYAGYTMSEGHPILGLILFGEPKAGGEKLSSIVSPHTMIHSYRNSDKDGHDIITDVPPLPPYIHIKEPLIEVSTSPDPRDPWLAFKYHHFVLYAESVGAAGPAVLALKH